MQSKILIVEDDVHLGQMLTLHFEDEGFKVQQVPSCEKARDALQHSEYDLVLLDQQLPDGTGIELLPQILQQDSRLPVIMMTGHHDLELAIQAIKQGAADFIHKPVKTVDLQAAVDKALESRRAQLTDDSGQAHATSLQLSRDLIGRSNAMLAVSKEIALSAQSNASILITGESGTGKELVARLIHQHSDRANGPFIAINCAAIVENLLESELFGHEKGAFTGANERKIGKFALAENGTLFLDEIGELALSIQAKLLRALQEHVIEPVGASSTIPVNARVITATNRDLFKMARDGQFREDLIYRLNVINIQMPPLRKRKEDIPLLAQALLEKSARELDYHTPQLTEDAVAKLQLYDWPGNVRELGNIMLQALLHGRGQAITAELIQLADNLDTAATGQPNQPTGDQVLRTLDQVEAEHIQAVLNHTGGHKSNSCRILGISRPALDRKIDKYQLQLPGNHNQ
ncbi:MAG: sigma-54 dependent transcriptional regulator [Chromatiales bacterium]|jgi:DNA-binding NtrC family response regulator